MENGKVSFLFMFPPRTTFSIAANPPYRSRKVPQGLLPEEPRTKLGNVCAFSGISLLLKTKKTGNPGMMETPRSSIRTALDEWERLAALDGFRSVWTSSCAFASPHLKQFLFLVCGFDPSSIHRKCSCLKKHLPVKGRATYTPGLVAELGATIQKVLVHRGRVMNAVDMIYKWPREGLCY